VCRKIGSAYGAAEFEAIKEAFLIKSQLTAGERPKRMMLQTANTEERAESGSSLRVRTGLDNLKKVDTQGCDPVFSIFKCSERRL
jgi:hypothetical protein